MLELKGPLEELVNLCVDNNVQEVIGDVYCLKCKTEKCFLISTNENSKNVFYDCKKCQSSCYVPNNPFKEQKLTMTLIDGDGTDCSAVTKSRLQQ